MTGGVQESAPNVVRYGEASRLSGAEPVARPAPLPADNRHRLMLISRPGLVSECLCHTLAERGFTTMLQPWSDPVGPLSFAPELAVFCVNQLSPGLMMAARRRIDELQGLVPGIPVMALVEEARRDELRDLAQLGIAATVTGLPSIDIAVAAIQFVIIGGRLMTAEIRLGLDDALAPVEHRLVDGRSSEGSGNLQDCRFTEREASVLERLRRGQPNKVIAHALGISESTVKVHLRSVMAKLKVTNRTQIVCMLGAPQDASVLQPAPIAQAGVASFDLSHPVSHACVSPKSR